MEWSNIHKQRVRSDFEWPIHKMHTMHTTPTFYGKIACPFYGAKRYNENTMTLDSFRYVRIWQIFGHCHFYINPVYYSRWCCKWLFAHRLSAAVVILDFSQPCWKCVRVFLLLTLASLISISLSGNILPKQRKEKCEKHKYPQFSHVLQTIKLNGIHSSYCCISIRIFHSPSL